MTMSLDEFMAEATADLERFRRMWLREHARNPAAFPLEIEDGLWTEQFLTFWTTGMASEEEEAETAGMDAEASGTAPGKP